MRDDCTPLIHCRTKRSYKIWLSDRTEKLYYIIKLYIFPDIYYAMRKEHDSTCGLFVSIQMPGKAQALGVYLRPVWARRTPVINPCRSQHRALVHELRCCVFALHSRTLAIFALLLFLVFRPCISWFFLFVFLIKPPSVFSTHDSVTQISWYCRQQDCNVIGLIFLS